MYKVRISIWGVYYYSLTMSLDQCKQAIRQAKEEYIGISAEIFSVDECPKD